MCVLAHTNAFATEKIRLKMSHIQVDQSTSKTPGNIEQVRQMLARNWRLTVSENNIKEIKVQHPRTCDINAYAVHTTKRRQKSNYFFGLIFSKGYVVSYNIFIFSGHMVNIYRITEFTSPATRYATVTYDIWVPHQNQRTWQSIPCCLFWFVCCIDSKRNLRGHVPTVLGTLSKVY